MFGNEGLSCPWEVNLVLISLRMCIRSPSLVSIKYGTYTIAVHLIGMSWKTFLSLEQDGRHFIDDTLNAFRSTIILSQLSLNFVVPNPLEIKSALFQGLAWRRANDEPAYWGIIRMSQDYWMERCGTDCIMIYSLKWQWGNTVDRQTS